MDLVGGSAASASLALDKLVSLLTGESKLLRGVGLSEVDSLRDELARLKNYLESSDVIISERDESVKNWLKEIKELAELVEDVIDEYILKVSQQPRQCRFINFLGKASRLIGTLNNRRNLSLHISNIRALLLEIKKSGQIYSAKRRRTIVEWYEDASVSPLLGECIAGFESAGNELMQRLTEGATKLSVISIVGIGGIGKTTLANKVYNNERVREHFDCHAWVTVSWSNDLKELLKIMKKKICKVEKHDLWEIDMMNTRDLITTLTQSLHSKRYMLVFDDVFQVDFWQVIKPVLPDDDNGSRIVITTQSDTVVAFSIESSFDHIHKLEPLSEVMSWDLFCRRAFQGNPEFRCPPELEQLSLEFIRMCDGMPLAIVAIAGLLSRKEKSVLEWKRILDSCQFQSELNPKLANVYKILALSFRDLPSQLKLCFLYFSIFPEDFLIPIDKLFKLWIAEGFVQGQTGLTLEEVAEEYLNELIRRNMVQACEGFCKLEKVCRVHELMYEIVRQKANEFGFCQVWDNNNSSCGRISRRLSIYNNVENVLETIEDSQIRSVFLFNVGSLNNSFVISLIERCKLLTLLDFENVPQVLLPEELGNLFHLKYLSLKNTKVRRLPKSVGKLHNLQTLDLRNTLLVELPIEINKLQNLRHLLASRYENKMSSDSTQGVRIKEGFGCLGNLQTLMTVEARIDLIKDLEDLGQLRRLGISRLTAEVASSLCACIRTMSHLECLSLHSGKNNEILDLQTISCPLFHLQRLHLKGQLQKFPDWFLSLQNLSRLCLIFSRLSVDPLYFLCRLPNLVSLWMYRAYEGEQLHFEEGGFPKLKLLVLRELHGLRVVVIEEGALPCLEELRIGSSPLLNEVPSGVQHLRNLKAFTNYDMPREFVLSMQPNGGSEYWKVQHVLSVLFWYRIEGNRCMLYKLGEPLLLNHLQGLATNNLAQRDSRLSFYYSDDEEEDSASTWNDVNQLSFSRDRASFFSDDIED